MKRRLTVRIPNEMFDFVELEAKKRSIPISSFICSVLAENIPKEHSTIISDDISIKDRITIILRNNDAAMLRIRAKNYGLSPTAFIRDIILNQNLKHIVIEPSLGRQIIEAFRDYDMDLQYLIHLYKSDASVTDKKEIIESAITGIADLTRLIIKYHKKLTRSHLALRDDILARIKEDKSGD